MGVGNKRADGRRGRRMRRREEEGEIHEGSKRRGVGERGRQRLHCVPGMGSRGKGRRRRSFWHRRGGRFCEDRKAGEKGDQGKRRMRGGSEKKGYNAAEGNRSGIGEERGAVREKDDQEKKGGQKNWIVSGVENAG